MRTHISGAGESERTMGEAYGWIKHLVLNQASGLGTGFVFRIRILPSSSSSELVDDWDPSEVDGLYDMSSSES